MTTHKTLKGPNGLKLELDANEIYPSDPGQGTPALVSLKVGDEEHTASFACAADTGELGCGDYQLNDEQVEWLNNQQQVVDDFIRAHTPQPA